MPDSLIRRLATIYAGEPIRHTHLKAVTLAQWMLESARGESGLATLHYNFGGLKFRPEMALYATRVRYAAHDGEDDYCKFATLESFIAGYWAFLNRAPYSGWESHVGSARQFIEFIGPIYDPSNADYAREVLDLVPEAQAMLYSVVNDLAEQDPARRDLGTIVIDPGHGGETNVDGSSANNAISVSGVKEKKLTLDFCLILRDRLIDTAASSDERVNVVLTRTTDRNLTGTERAGKAFETMAKAFICFHFNGLNRPDVRGAETFFRSSANGNLNLAQDMAFARVVHEGLIAGLRAIDDDAVDRGLKPDDESGPGALGVLNDSRLGNDRRPDKCVAAYIEAEFITNPAVDRLLISGPDAIPNRNRMMEELAEGLCAYMRAN